MSAPAVAVLPAEELALEIEQAYLVDWDAALAEKAYRRDWDAALAQEDWFAKDRAALQILHARFEAYKEEEAKWLENPMNRLITYECNESMKRLRASKRKRTA